MKKILIILAMLLTPFLAIGILIAVFFLIFSILEITHPYEDYIIKSEKKPLVNCGLDKGKIKKATYGGGGGDQVSELIYYEKDNKKILINHIIDIYGIDLDSGYKTENIKKNWNFFKNMDLEAAQIGHFSILKFMQKDKYDVINQERYKSSKQNHQKELLAMHKKINYMEQDI